jgi:hypothetical protein
MFIGIRKILKVRSSVLLSKTWIRMVGVASKKKKRDDIFFFCGML